MLPSSAVRPPRGKPPTPSEPCRLLHEKAAGLSCRRRAWTDLSITTSITAPAGSPWGGAPPGGRLSILNRPPAAVPTPPRGRAGTCGLADGARLVTGSVQPPIGRKASLMRTTRPSTSTTPGTVATAPKVIDTGRSALGRAATTLGSKPFRRQPDEQGGTIGAGSDAFAY